MSRTPFDPMQSAAMRNAQARKAAPKHAPDAPPLSPQQERALIEAHAASLSGGDLPPLSDQAAGSPRRPLTISETNTVLSQVLSVALPAIFFVQGEISNFRTYDRGHAFFTLKDASAELPCILWKDGMARLKFRPADGLSVIARGSVRLYEPQGKIQLYVETLLPQGAGSLELAFRQLCDKLRKEGLFEQARKRPLPKLPQHVAIITSRTGDVLHDVLTTAYRRYPGLHTMLYPVRVQGDQAPTDIIRAIQNLNAYADSLHLKLETRNLKPDLILLVRGGGSLEDLAAFNDEALARAIVASKIPIATGIGHEPDTTIADLVGDLRGPTPTGVTELTIPDTRVLLADLQNQAALFTRDLRRTLTLAKNTLDRTALHLSAATIDAARTRRQKVDTLHRHITRIEPRHAIAQGWRRVEESQRHLETATQTRLRHMAEGLTKTLLRLERTSPRVTLLRHRDHLTNLQTRLACALQIRHQAATQRLAALATQLRIVSPDAVLERGFSITTDKDGNIVRSADQVKRGDVIKTQVSQGTIHSTVGKPKQATLF